MSLTVLFCEVTATPAFVLSFIAESFQAAEGANHLFQVGIALGGRHSGDALEAVLAVDDLELGNDNGQGGFAVVEPGDVAVPGQSVPWCGRCRRGSWRHDSSCLQT